MNRETIEKSAKDYAETIWKTKDARFVSQYSFMKGVEWFMKSIWHDVDEKPKFKGKVEVSSFLVLRKSGQIGLIQVSKDDWEDILDLTKFAKWADVDDLLPDGKEAQS